MKPFVVIGAGQAGVQICDSLRKGGYEGPLILCGDEPGLPYQRPPLSKKFLSGDISEERMLFRPGSYFEKTTVEVRPETRVTRIDRGARRLETDSGPLDYEKLALTTGTRVRPLTCPGADSVEIHYIRTLADSSGLREAMAGAGRLLVIGGGFIGLEVAAMARSLDHEVVVVEAVDRLMARAVSPEVSAYYADLHRAQGVDLRLGVGVEGMKPSGSGVCTTLANGEEIVADVVVAGIGVVPNVELADECGLTCNNGIVVDEFARTSDPDIVAAGDCTWHTNNYLDQQMRLESVQNAVDQAKVAAASMLGESKAYHAVPWFWSDQYDAKLQMAGISSGFDRAVLRGDIDDGAFSYFYFRGEKLLGADSVNRPADHMACRKLLQQGTLVTPADAGDMNVDLKALGKS